jgi:hypothetical protein
MRKQFIAGRGMSLRLMAFCVAAVLGAASAIAVPASQEPKEPDMVSKRVRLRGADDPNIATGDDVNIRAKPSSVVPPPSKSPQGQALCAVTFDNHTDLIAKTYIDGHFAGTIRPFAELSTSIVPGSAVLYARAEYDDGSVDAWGPIRVGCRTKYVWRLAD